MVGLKGFVSFGNNFKLEGLGETIELDKVKDNADVYDGIAATSNNGTINKNVMIGSLKVTTDDGKVDVAANKSAVLYKADGNGNLVSNNKGTADVSLGDGSTLTLAGNGKAGAIEAGTANKGSITFGHAKASGTVVAGGWSLAPNADLTITFNSGDTEAKSTTTFIGARAIDLNSEVLDEVTYGVTLGLGAQYGAFGTSFGINYTGSDNTDAFGVNAQCRYMF